MAEVKVELTKEEKLSIINKDLPRFFELNETIKILENEQKELRSEIMSLIKDKDVCENQVYNNGEYVAEISKGSNSSLKPLLIEQVLKVKVTDECYGTTYYDKLSVKKADQIKKANNSKKKKETQLLQETSNEVKFNVEL